jgi:hypothetical protein
MTCATCARHCIWSEANELYNRRSPASRRGKFLDCGSYCGCRLKFRQQSFPFSSHDLDRLTALLGIDQQVGVCIAPRGILQNFLRGGGPDRLVVELEICVGWSEGGFILVGDTRSTTLELTSFWQIALVQPIVTVRTKSVSQRMKKPRFDSPEAGGA